MHWFVSQTEDGGWWVVYSILPVEMGNILQAEAKFRNHHHAHRWMVETVQKHPEENWRILDLTVATSGRK